MKSNLGSIDRLVRILAAVAIAVLYFTHAISGTTAVILIVIGLVLLLTALMNFCPLYYLLGIRTRKKSIQS